MARPIAKELKWMVLAGISAIAPASPFWLVEAVSMNYLYEPVVLLDTGVVYVVLCALLLFSNMENVEYMDPLSQGLPSLIKGRGPKEAASPNQDVEGVGLNRMVSLVRSPMFREQGNKLKWIKERILRCVHHLCMCVRERERYVDFVEQ